MSFSGFLATKCTSLNNESCIIRPTLIYLDAAEFNYYPCMFSLGKCSGSCNATDDLSTKIKVPSKTKYINVKVFNMIKRINEAKTLVKHISRGCKRMFNSTRWNSDQKWNNKTCQCECKDYCTYT